MGATFRGQTAVRAVTGMPGAGGGRGAPGKIRRDAGRVG
ncbi:Hypothetical protein A7982_10494 [Minicystis rosea]|nr:Hypothetical protein A7982_10494 [Minicystis rosea]